MEVGSLILDLSSKEVLTEQTWRDNGPLPRSTMTEHRPLGGQEWLWCRAPPVLSGRAVARVAGASVPVPSMGAVLGCVLGGVSPQRL